MDNWETAGVPIQKSPLRAPTGFTRVAAEPKRGLKFFAGTTPVDATDDDEPPKPKQTSRIVVRLFLFFNSFLRGARKRGNRLLRGRAG